jgi:hypothetical protein
MVVIAESTRKLVGNLFDLHDLGAKELKGIDGPVRACDRRQWKAASSFAREWTDRACRSIGRTRTAAAALVKGEDHEG